MWDPSLYLRYGDERTRPCLDLIQRIELAELGRIVDLGCGPGNSTAALEEIWQRRPRLRGQDHTRVSSVAGRLESPRRRRNGFARGNGRSGTKRSSAGSSGLRSRHPARSRDGRSRSHSGRR